MDALESDQPPFKKKGPTLFSHVPHFVKSGGRSFSTKNLKQAPKWKFPETEDAMREFEEAVEGTDETPSKRAKI